MRASSTLSVGFTAYSASVFPFLIRSTMFSLCSVPPQGHSLMSIESSKHLHTNSFKWNLKKKISSNNAKHWCPNYSIVILLSVCFFWGHIHWDIGPPPSSWGKENCSHMERDMFYVSVSLEACWKLLIWSDISLYRLAHGTIPLPPTCPWPSLTFFSNLLWRFISFPKQGCYIRDCLPGLSCVLPCFPFSFRES